MLTVALDLRATEAGFKAHAGRGTGRYATELARHLIDSPARAQAAGVCIRRVTSDDLRRRPWEDSLLARLPFGRRTVESQLLFPSRVRRLGADVIHFMAHGDASAFSRTPQIVTVLDLIPLRFPDLYRADKPNWRFRFARALEYGSIRRALGIIAISEATKRDLIELLHVPAERIAVTPLAVGREFLPASVTLAGRREEIEMLRRRLGLPAGRAVLLYVGGIDPRKNVPFLLETLREVKTTLGQERTPVLVLAGRHEGDDQRPKLLEAIERLDLARDVVCPGFVADDELPLLYQSADIFLFPSLYEGFGLPVLEAMASGTAVIAGNNSSVPEVAGQSALLCTDNDLSGWSKAVLDLLQSVDRRRRLAGAGVSRAAAFSWEKTAHMTLDAYREFSRPSLFRRGRKWIRGSRVEGEVDWPDAANL